jgi:hypothetical protein
VIPGINYFVGKNFVKDYAKDRRKLFYVSTPFTVYLVPYLDL